MPGINANKIAKYTANASGVIPIFNDENLPYLDINEIASFNENNNRIKFNISSCPVKFGGDK